MIATETYAPAVNGAAVFTQRLAAGLAGRGHTVGVVAPSPTGRPYPEWHGGGLTIYRTRSAPTPYPRQRCALLTLRGAEAILAPFRPDVVHIQNHFVLGRTLARAARVRHIPTVGTNHFMAENMLPHVPRILRAGAVDRLLYHELWRQFVALYGQLDCVTVPSHAAADLVRTQGLSGRMHVISNGVDVARFHPALDVYGAARDGLLILYVGRLDPEKGVDTLIRAMPSVLRSHAATLVLSGRGVHEPTLRGLAEALDLSARVRFTGFVPDDELPAQYQAATLFVMPSRNELQSLATLEAMATGLPIVAADRMALPELVEDGTNGFLFPSGDPVTLADRIVRLLSDPAQAARMGQASRRVAERHGLQRTLAAFEALYEEFRLTGRALGPVKPATRCWFRPWG